MADLKTLLVRQKSAQTIGRMASAMKMVSQAKFNRLKDRVKQAQNAKEILENTAARLLAQRMQELERAPPDAQVSWALLGHSHVLEPVFAPGNCVTDGGISSPDSERSGHDVAVSRPWILLIMTSQAGLCGGFVQRLIKEAKKSIACLQKRHGSVLCLVIGEKGRKEIGVQTHGASMTSQNWLAEWGTSSSWAQEADQKLQTQGVFDLFPPDVEAFEVYGQRWFPNPLYAQGTQSPENALQSAGAQWPSSFLITALLEKFSAGQIQGCSVLYSRFHNILRQEPKMIDLLPISIIPNPQGLTCPEGVEVCGPSVALALEYCLRLWLFTTFQALALEHALSENGARVSAMDGAQENAKELIKKLKLAYNYVRQALITKELNEIIGGSEAGAAM